MDSQAILALLASTEAEVSYLEVVVTVEQDVFWLEISVDDSADVVEVLYAAEELVEIVPAELFVKSPFCVLDFDVGEKITLLH